MKKLGPTCLRPAVLSSLMVLFWGRSPLRICGFQLVFVPAISSLSVAYLIFILHELGHAFGGLA